MGKTRSIPLNWKEPAMKNANLLVWVMQLGLSLTVPMACFVFLGVWLHYSIGWGRWVLILGIVLGIFTGIQSLLSALKIMHRMGKTPSKETPQSYNDHT